MTPLRSRDCATLRNTLDTHATRRYPSTAGRRQGGTQMNKSQPGARVADAALMSRAGADPPWAPSSSPTPMRSRATDGGHRGVRKVRLPPPRRANGRQSPDRGARRHRGGPRRRRSSPQRRFATRSAASTEEPARCPHFTSAAGAQPTGVGSHSAPQDFCRREETYGIYPFSKRANMCADHGGNWMPAVSSLLKW